MTDQVFGPFSNAVREVCKQMLDVSAEFGAASPGNVPPSGDKVNIMVGFTGDYSGETYYIFPRNTALEIVKSMSGMEIDDIDEFVTSALSEISNIISGNAMTGLSELAIACDIQPPQLVEGGESIYGGGERVIRTGIRTPLGDIDLVVKLHASRKMHIEQ